MNFKSFIYRGLYGMMAIVASVSLTACGGDDDGEPGGGGSESVTESPWASGANVLLTSIEEVGERTTVYEYDSKNRPVNCYYNSKYSSREDSYSIDYASNKIDLYLDDEFPPMNISFTSSGNISRLNGSAQESVVEDGVKYSYSMSFNWEFKYNGEGRLTHSEVYTKMAYSVGDMSDENWGQASTDYSWSDGKLVKIQGTAKNYEGKEYGEWTSEGTLTFTYGSKENKYCQYPASLEMDGDLSFFAIGLVGKGPSVLPESQHYVSVEKSKNGTNNIDYEARAEFVVNTDATIASEKWIDTNTNSTRCEYIYNYSSKNSSTKAIAPWQQSKKLSVREKFNRMMNAFSIRNFK